MARQTVGIGCVFASATCTRYMVLPVYGMQFGKQRCDCGIHSREKQVSSFKPLFYPLFPHKIQKQREAQIFSSALHYFCTNNYPFLSSRCTPLDLCENAVRCSKLATNQRWQLLRNPHLSTILRFSNSSNPWRHHLPSGDVYLDQLNSPKSKPLPLRLFSRTNKNT